MLFIPFLTVKLPSHILCLLASSQTRASHLLFSVSILFLAGACSLPDPGVTCTKEFEKSIAVSKGDEEFCR